MSTGTNHNEWNKARQRRREHREFLKHDFEGAEQVLIKQYHRRLALESYAAKLTTSDRYMRAIFLDEIEYAVGREMRRLTACGIQKCSEVEKLCSHTPPKWVRNRMS